MPLTFLKYALAGGYIHHWLACGPLEIPVGSTDTVDNSSTLDVQTFLLTDPVLMVPSVDLGPIGLYKQQNPPPTWHYLRCREDHYVDFISNDLQPGSAISYCVTFLVSPCEQDVIFRLTANGLVNLRLNHQDTFQTGSLDQLSPKTNVFQVKLQPGENEILVRLASSAHRQARSQCALYLDGPAAQNIEISLPTEIEPEYIKKRLRLEEVVEGAYLDRYVYGQMEGDLYNRNEALQLRYANTLNVSEEVTFRLQSLTGDIFQEGTNIVGASSQLELARKFPLRSGPHHLALQPPAGLYFVKKLQFERKELFFVVRTPYSTKVPVARRERVKAALTDAAERRGGSLYSEIAKMAIQRWEEVNLKVILTALEKINQQKDDTVRDLLGLLGILMRFGKKRGFPKDLQQPILNALISYPYAAAGEKSDRPDLDIESNQILCYTCQILAGQVQPRQTFAADGRDGQALREQGENLAMEWMQARGKFGFRQWNSPSTYEASIAALTHLVDYAESDAVSELAAVLLDKIFFELAINSHQGAFAASRGYSRTEAVFSARLAATTGISRLMFGRGNFNDAVMGLVSLACCQNYRLPKPIAAIAADHPAAIWSREQHCQPINSMTEHATDLWHANTVTYRTADYMLSSAQDYYPGQPGQTEHIWQAALGPDAVVFTNHPVNMSESDAHQPNLWRGNGSLPRVAQWGDVLIAIYQLPDDDWMGFTHAYFPTTAFDEVQFIQNWAFARKGQGYLALTAANGLNFIATGQTAQRELRSPGCSNAWFCHMGQEILDGSFIDFQAKILAMDYKIDSAAVQVKSLRGDTLSFGWQGAFMVNGEPQPLDNFPHIENAYCLASLPANQIDIIRAQTGIRLKFDE